MTDKQQLEIRFVPLSQVVLWDDNPKQHDIGSIIDSIMQSGFRDPPAWDETLQGLIEGNGRTQALREMKECGMETPKGITVNESNGEWMIPVLYGLDAETKSSAVKYAIDHNNITLMGGDFSVHDITRLWNRDSYLMALQELDDENDMPVSIDSDDLAALISRRVFEEDQSGDQGGNQEQSVANPPLPQSDNELGKMIVVGVANDIFVTDIFDAINDIIVLHPEWEATLTIKEYQRKT